MVITTLSLESQINKHFNDVNDIMWKVCYRVPVAQSLRQSELSVFVGIRTDRERPGTITLPRGQLWLSMALLLGNYENDFFIEKC